MKTYKQTKINEDRRIAPRVPCSTAVAYATQSLSSIEYIQDISAWGVFIRTKAPVPVGEDISLTIPPQSGDGSPLTIIGQVVRTTNKGIGIKFKMGIDDSVIKPLIKKK